MHRNPGLGPCPPYLSHPESGSFSGIPPRGISLRGWERPVEGCDCWARQEGSGTLVPAFRHTNKPTAWRLAQSCPRCQGSSHYTRQRTEPGPRESRCLEPLASATSLPATSYSPSQWLGPRPWPWVCIPGLYAGQHGQKGMISKGLQSQKSTFTPIRQIHRLDQQIQGYSENLTKAGKGKQRRNGSLCFLAPG